MPQTKRALHGFYHAYRGGFTEPPQTAKEGKRGKNGTLLTHGIRNTLVEY
jgi:hypothetical protein